MKYFSFFVGAIAGLTGGLFVGIAKNGFTNTGETILCGLVCAVLIGFMVFDSASREKKKHLSRQRRTEKRIRRTKVQASQTYRRETEGSFSQRMERFSINVAQREQSSASKMPYWSASETDEYERSAPKPVGQIRALLQRIRSILSGQ